MTAPTPLVTTIQRLAHEEWKENACPVIHNGRLISWNPYYFDEGDLTIAAYVARTQGLSHEESDLFAKKVKENLAKKITGQRIIVSSFSSDDRRCMRSFERIAFVDSSAKPNEAIIFPKESFASVVKNTASIEAARSRSPNSDMIEFKEISNEDKDHLIALSRLALEKGEFKITGHKRLKLANNEHLDLPDYYIKALRQDSPIFDKIFAGEHSMFYLTDMTKDDLNLLITYAYDGLSDRHRLILKSDQILHIGILALHFQMENVLVRVRQTLFDRMIFIEGYEKFDSACDLYRIFAGSRYPQVMILKEYFSSEVSKCNLDDFRRSIVKLNEIGLTSFKLWPQNDGNDNEKIGILVELMTNLESLDLSCQDNLNPRKLDFISGLKKLEWLFLNSCHKLDDAALAEIGKVTTLTNLVLSGKTVTDKGLTNLGNLSHLRQIVIFGPSSITDAGVKVFNQIKTLEWVRLNECSNVSVETLKKLHASHVSNKYM